MKIAWLCNTLIPEAAEKLGIICYKPESWITGIYNQIKSLENIEIIYLYSSARAQEDLTIGNSVFISFCQDSEKNINRQKDKFISVIKKYSPDVIHIFGTEHEHSYAMIKACEELGVLDKAVISIQGLVSVYAKHYYAALPEYAVHAFSFKDFVKNTNIKKQTVNFSKRGFYEEETLKITKNVIGRTDWDKACTTRLNPKVNYHFCNETLRSAFYENEWTLEECEKHSIFVSQCSYPIKGFHLMLEAFADVVKEYPDAHLYTTGLDPLKLNLNQKIRQSYYSKYLGKLIKKFKLQGKVTFLGYLNEKQMCERYLKSNVFVSPSSIENSPNSVGEAMILGIPTISSDVGGVKNLLEHNKEGFIYQADAPYMAAYYIKQIFADDELALKLSKNAKAHATKTHNQDKNFEDLINIYKNIANQG